MAKAAKWKIARNSKPSFSNLPKREIQGYSLWRRYARPPANSILTEKKFLDFLDNHPNFGPANLAQQFRFGEEQDYSTPDLYSSQNRLGTKASIPNSPISTWLEFPGVHTISAANSFSLQHMHTNKWSALLAGFGRPEEQFYRNSTLSVDKLCQIILEDFGKLRLFEKYLVFCRSITLLGFSQQFEAQQSLQD